jgi:predicted flap endonuclease-1-like 5' DNA nuclease
MINQQGILDLKADFDSGYIENLIGWEVTRQTTWAALTVSCLVGIFSLIKLLNDRNSAYVRALLELAYTGCTLAFWYCILKLLWSYQLVRKYETLLGRASGMEDVIQNFLFSSTGAMSNEGVFIIIGLLGLTAALLLQIPHMGNGRKEENKRQKELVGKARTLLEKKAEKPSEKASIDLTQVKNIGPKTAKKLKEAGFTDPQALADSKPEEIAKVLGISERRASAVIENARSLLKNNKNEVEE